MPPKKKPKVEAVPAPVSTYDRSKHCSSQPDGSWMMDVPGTHFKHATKVIYYQYEDAPQRLDFLLNMHSMRHFHVLADPEPNGLQLQPPPTSCSVLWRRNIQVLYITATEADVAETKLDPPLVPKTRYIHSLKRDALVAILQWIAFFPVGELAVIIFIPRSHMASDASDHVWNIASSIASACNQQVLPSEVKVQVKAIADEKIPPSFDPMENEYLIRLDVITTVSCIDFCKVAMDIKRTRMIPVLWNMIYAYI